jgi:transcriptional regulator with XRE-family HTH domain
MAISLRTARRLARLTQTQLAERSGVSQGTIAAIERGAHSNPTLETAYRLARALGVDPEELFEVPRIPGEAVR